MFKKKVIGQLTSKRKHYIDR